jgi:ABC-2 type transport system ATP-binding protein
MPTLTSSEPVTLDIRAEGVTKHFRISSGKGVTALDRLDLAAAQGTVTVLAGPNGAGKSTVLRLVAGLLKPDEGSLRIAGIDVATESDRTRGMVGYVAETPSLYDRLYPAEYLRFFAALYDVPRDRQQARVAELLLLVELQDVQRRIGTFSKGMKQRLNVARAILHHPKILLLDEPADGLDAAARNWLYRLVGDFAHQQGGLVLVASHHLQELDGICDVLMVMRSGKVLVSGSPREVRRAAMDGAGATANPSGTAPDDSTLSLDDACLRILGLT